MKLTKALLKKIDQTVWTITEGVGYTNGDYVSENETFEGALQYSWIKADHIGGRIQIILNVSKPEKKGPQTFGDEGTTRYKLDGETYWSSFDRRGVESSFTVGGKYSPYKDFSEAIVGETKRVEERLARIKAAGGYVDVPGTGYRVTEARKAEMIAILNAGKPVSLTPSGFGRGFTFATKISRRAFNYEYASEAQRKFFGVKSLYYAETEHD
jgi:hypothetical protein